MAYEVEYYGLIPLISPIVDGVDQRKTRWNLKIYTNYYNSYKFEVLLISDEAEDFIYPAKLKDKGIVIALEWDSPVLPTKVLYNKGEGRGEGFYIPGMNYGLDTVNSTSEAIKQINYRKSYRFFKLASQRLMAFVDTSTPEGAKTLFNGKISPDILDPLYKDRTKKDFLYTID